MVTAIDIKVRHLSADGLVVRCDAWRAHPALFCRYKSSFVCVKDVSEVVWLPLVGLSQCRTVRAFVARYVELNSVVAGRSGGATIVFWIQ